MFLALIYVLLVILILLLVGLVFSLFCFYFFLCLIKCFYYFTLIFFHFSRLDGFFFSPFFLFLKNAHECIHIYMEAISFHAHVHRESTEMILYAFMKNTLKR
ncbi:hypothetical protein TRFO_36030 [Tritrichomonas foetus]|uniref:Uncharacterized protein n=1 Tax=Tritrichomonas foetus TaxID=1144522 RepID=A0A1J4JGC2_9EUKA|nr:hypothetical protein TRFO_36030 [Tritrichomonas foetus]|eukprot:OHS97705.1 hypothetical protein TRFO_36030 [Tritrichomonas foetus]